MRPLPGARPSDRTQEGLASRRFERSELAPKPVPQRDVEHPSPTSPRRSHIQEPQAGRLDGPESAGPRSGSARLDVLAQTLAAQAGRSASPAREQVRDDCGHMKLAARSFTASSTTSHVQALPQAAASAQARQAPAPRRQGRPRRQDLHDQAHPQSTQNDLSIHARRAFAARIRPRPSPTPLKRGTREPSDLQRRRRTMLCARRASSTLLPSRSAEMRAVRGKLLDRPRASSAGMFAPRSGPHRRPERRGSRGLPAVMLRSHVHN